jgi:hypothetical protein
MSGTACDTFQRLNDTVYLIPTFLQSFNCILNHRVWHSMVLLGKKFIMGVSNNRATEGTSGPPLPKVHSGLQFGLPESRISVNAKSNVVHNFTVGQRKDLGVATGSPLYVIQIKGDVRQVVVGNQEDLYSKTLRAQRVNLISVDGIEEPMAVQVKIRHRHAAAAATIGMTAEDEILVTFADPQRAITPGQAAVFYQDDVVVGGGWIV